MKTPHRITIIRGDTLKQYDPTTDSYVNGETTSVVVPCHINFITQQKVFEEYGNRTDKVMVCRFMQECEPFSQAEYAGEVYEPIEAIDAPIKGAVRLRRASDG